jgi:hypothetical protein
MKKHVGFPVQSYKILHGFSHKALGDFLALAITYSFLNLEFKKIIN